MLPVRLTLATKQQGGFRFDLPEDGESEQHAPQQRQQ